MKLTTLLIPLLIGSAVAIETRWNFDKNEAGKPPKGWTAASGIWTVVKDATAPSKSMAMAQQAKSDSELFNVIVADTPSIKHVEIAVKLKSVAGEVDQGGGVVWRYRDAQNYYVCRFNPLETNFRVYKVVAGKRTTLKAAADIKVPTGKWVEVKAVMSVDRIRCYLNGKLLLEVKDATLTEAGKVGLWTKADAQTLFDDLIAREAPVMSDARPHHQPKLKLEERLEKRELWEKRKR